MGRDWQWAVPSGVALGFAAQQLVGGVAGFALAFAVLLALVLLVSWLRGRRGWRIDAETTVPAPPGAAFAILDDPARASELDGRIERTEVTGPPGAGRREVHHMRLGRRDVAIEAVVVDRRPPSLLVHDIVAVTIDGKPADAGSQRQTFVLEPGPAGTVVRLAIRGHASGTGGRLTLGMRQAAEARAARALLERLRAAV